MTNTPEEIASKLDAYFRSQYGVALADLEISNTPGCWRKRYPCDPKTCGSPIHSFLGCSGPMQHTVQYLDCQRNQGRFASPYASWRAMRAAILRREEPDHAD